MAWKASAFLLCRSQAGGLVAKAVRELFAPKLKGA